MIARSTAPEIRSEEKSDDAFDILILGPVPPPFGGISVHLSRLIPELEHAGFKVGVLNHFRSTALPFVVASLSKNPLNYYRVPKRFRTRLVHYHHSRWFHLVALALGKRKSRARYILTLHAGDIQKHFGELVSTAPFVSRITRWALSRFDTVICVDARVASLVREQLDGQRVEVLPAFLESPGQAGEYDATIESFFNSGRVLVVAAYGVQFLEDGRELYGLDAAVHAFTTLAPEREDLRLAIFIARRPSRRRARRHLERLEQRLEGAGIRDRALVVFERPLVPALRANAVFVRPTRAEGDALSVREAQRAGIPVVASDVVPRPRGVATFREDDVAELCATLRAVLDGRIQTRSNVASVEATSATDENFSRRLIELYREELAISRHS